MKEGAGWPLQTPSDALRLKMQKQFISTTQDIKIISLSVVIVHLFRYIKTSLLR